MASACSGNRSSNIAEPTRAPTEGLPRTGSQRPGLELVTWHVDESDELDANLARVAKPALKEPQDDRLTRNGMLLMRLQESDLPALVDSLDGINATMSTWCGQVTDWRHLRDVPVKRAIIEVGSKRTLLAGGTLAMAARAWVEPTLDGARLHLEFVPRFQTDRRPRASILRSRAPQVHAFDELAEATDLRPGEVLLLTSTAPPPPIQPPAVVEGPPAGDDPDPTDDPAEDNPIPDSSGRIGRSIEIGHALFQMPSEAPERVILVLVPRVPENLLPPTSPGRPRRMSADTETNR